MSDFVSFTVPPLLPYSLEITDYGMGEKKIILCMAGSAYRVILKKLKIASLDLIAFLDTHVWINKDV